MGIVCEQQELPFDRPVERNLGTAALTGTWGGTWSRSVGGGGELVLTMGDKPTFKRSGTLCPPEETPATVTVSGDRVTIEVSTEAVTATYTGTRSGNEITGEPRRAARARARAPGR